MRDLGQWFFDRVYEVQARESLVRSLVNEYTVKTAGGLLDNSRNHVIKGWLYANSSELLFVSDRDPVLLFGMPPVTMDSHTASPSSSRRHRLSRMESSTLATNLSSLVRSPESSKLPCLPRML